MAAGNGWQQNVAVTARGLLLLLLLLFVITHHHIAGLQLPKARELVDLLEGDEEDELPGAEAHVGGQEALVERQGTLCAHGLDSAVQGPCRAWSGRRAKGNNTKRG